MTSVTPYRHRVAVDGSDGPICYAETRGMFTCTLAPNHDGDHEAAELNIHGNYEPGDPHIVDDHGREIVVYVTWPDSESLTWSSDALKVRP